MLSLLYHSAAKKGSTILLLYWGQFLRRLCKPMLCIYVYTCISPQWLSPQRPNVNSCTEAHNVRFCTRFEHSLCRGSLITTTYINVNIVMCSSQQWSATCFRKHQRHLPGLALEWAPAGKCNVNFGRHFAWLHQQNNAKRMNKDERRQWYTAASCPFHVHVMCSQCL